MYGASFHLAEKCRVKEKLFIPFPLQTLTEAQPLSVRFTHPPPRVVQATSQGCQMTLCPTSLGASHCSAGCRSVESTDVGNEMVSNK